MQLPAAQPVFSTLPRLAAALALATALLAPLAGSAVTVDWVTVAPGNTCDVNSHGCFGAVSASYRISKYEVTNAQYAEFLNGVAATDTNALYNENMGNDTTFGGITRSNSSGSFSYAAKAGFESKPVVYVNWYDSLRFANWLNNGEPVGAQGPATTEGGAYTITLGGIAANSITRNPGAHVFLPSEDEWYRAAYYDPVSASFFDYPTGTNMVTSCVLPGSDTGNSANCWPATAPAPGALTDVGAYTLSMSPSGTYDQGGNVFEWNESIPAGSLSPPGTSLRGNRGGSWQHDASFLASSNLNDGGYPTDEDRYIGFRVASIPEPGECDDGIDNDGDGKIDLADTGCAWADDPSENEDGHPCDDGIDNDGDGLADFPADPGCADAEDLDEHSPTLACDDGADNDADGLTDFPDDPDCTSPLDATESPDSDGDLVPDSLDNCKYEPNPTQSDIGGIGLASPPDGIGDACQCGDTNNNGRVTATDSTVLKRALLGLTPYFEVAALPGLNKCNVGSTVVPGILGCTTSDASVIARALLGLTPGIAQHCDAASP